MTPAEAKMRLFAEWRLWIGHQQAKDSLTDADARAFFSEVSQNHADLLAFESGVDKLQLLTLWLADAGLIKTSRSTV